MKVLNAIFSKKIGGVAQAFCDYSEVLAKNGHEVQLVLQKGPEYDVSKLGAKKIHFLKSLSQITDFLHFLYIIKTFRPDIIISHNNRISKWMKFARFFTKAKSIGVNHGVGFKGSLNCDYTLSVNEEIRKMVTDSGFDQKKSFIIYNAIKIDQPFIQKEFPNKSKITIGAYGRIEAIKGFDILIKALSKIVKYFGESKKIRLKLGGFDVEKSGYGFSNLKELAIQVGVEENLKFVGTVKDKKSFFEDVDIFIVPSREESFGIVILESFLYSTLVISSKTQGAKIIINDQNENSQNGILFELENFEDLSNKIINLLENPKKYKDITKNAYVKLQKEFSYKNLGQKLQIILDEIAES